MKKLWYLLLLLIASMESTTAANIRNRGRQKDVQVIIPYQKDVQVIKPYQYDLSACLMFYNENFFLKEWLEYHKLIGFEHFYLFNNASTDNYLEILKPYIYSGEVELFDSPQRGVSLAEQKKIQCELYNIAIAKARGKSKWLAIIDADEFVYPVKEKPLVDILNGYENFGGVFINYLYFGTSQIQKIGSDRTIIESLNHCAKTPSGYGRSIVRPERVNTCTNPNMMIYHPPFYHVNMNGNHFEGKQSEVCENTLLIYHYYLGDIDHAVNITFPRREKWINVSKEAYLEIAESMNVQENNSMQRFVKELRKKMNLPSN